MTTAALAAEPAPPGTELVRVYVWELPVRVTHWLIVLSIVVLSVTGLYIGHPFLVVTGPSSGRFVMGTMRVVHLYAGIVFGLAVLARIVWMFTGNTYARWDKLLPVRHRRRQGILPTIAFYLFALRKPPGFVGHNPVAGLAYVAVFLIYFVEITTGLTLHAAAAHLGSPLRAFAALAPFFGGLQTARWIHHVGMWLLIGFAIHHVYSSVLMSVVEANATVESMFSGYKFVPREDLVYSGYRFIDRRDARDGDG
ncbi:MAG TPA: Ni/Fe-hydrogenase, b-type cytochrome subunit [Candidatus Binatia bacterium]|nr:Ni/Fe-hydrogenase, b-type cytochrome subunit [Candidatus Binatia bacterium]